jgi:superfamily II DNA or RNA helicase
MEEFIVVFTERRLLGMTAIAYVSSKKSTEGFITLHEQLTPERIKNQSISITPDQQKIVEILDEISDKKLHRKFSREKNTKQFLDTLKQDVLEKRIRPEIENRINQCFQIFANNPDIQVYYKNSNYGHLYPTDRVFINSNPSGAVFDFKLEPDHLEYSLQINDGQKTFAITNRELLFITHDPCSFILNHKLYYFTDIDSKKLKPFIEKPALRIPQQSIDTYFEKFVLNCIRDFEVNAHGFNIEDKSGQPQAVLCLEQDLEQQAVLTLKYIYKDREYLAGTKSKVYVELVKTDNTFTFYKIQRNFEWENKIIQILKDSGLELSGNCHFRPANIINEAPSITLLNLINWLNSNSQTLMNQGFGIIQKFFNEKFFLGKPDLQFKNSEEKDWFELHANIQIGNYSFPFVRFRKHILTQNRKFELPDGTFFIIPDEWFTKYTELLHFAKNGNDDTLLLDKHHFNLLNVTKDIESRYASIQTKGDAISTPMLPVPEGLNATLRNYQMQGYSWLNYLADNQLGGILADDMGLGKTIQTIALLLRFYLKSNQSPEANSIHPTAQLSLFDQPKITGFNTTPHAPSLIVMPTSLIHNWNNEIQKFAPALKTYIYTGSNRLKTKEINKILRHYHVILSTYGVIRNDIGYFQSLEFSFIILDESQYIKNPSSKIYEAVMDLKGKHKLVLTGTPIENSLNDLWAQLNFVNPGLLGTLNYFRNQFVTPIMKQQNESMEKRLRTLIHPFILRRTKEEVAKELPPITEQTLYCNMTPEQAKVYEREKSGIRNHLIKAIEESGLEKSSIIALQALTRLRQLAIHPVLVDDTYTGSSGKFEQILENLESIVSEDHKVLVFSSFVKDLELIEQELIQRNLNYSMLTGATTDREKVINNFTGDKKCRIFLISLKAGGVGLNLTDADYVFMLNPWWNPAAENQAISRSHRIGQKRNVFVYRFISTDTIEEKIARLQESKLALADTFINSNNPFKNLTIEEVKELFA